MSSELARGWRLIPTGLGILALVCYLASPGCSTHGPSELELPSDFAYTYKLHSGSLAPPYQFSIAVSAEASSRVCEATITGSDPVDPPSLTVTYEVCEDSLLAVLQQMIDSRIFRATWEQVQCPCGGSVRSLEVTANGDHYHIPPSPGCVRDEESLIEVCGRIWMSIPPALRDSLWWARGSWTGRYDREWRW